MNNIKKDHIMVIRYLIWQEQGKYLTKSVWIGDYEILPTCFRWDAWDVKILKCIENIKVHNELPRWESFLLFLGRKGIYKLAIAYLQKRYKGVFLENTETLFLSEKARKEIPDYLWNDRLQEMWELHWNYLKVTLEDILKRKSREGEKRGAPITLVLALPQEGEMMYLEEWLETLWGKPWVQQAVADFMLVGSSQQQEKGEEILEYCYEETGIAGNFYDSMKSYRREMEERVYMGDSVKRKVLFLDCMAVSVKELGKMDVYIDGTGRKTKSEIRRAENAGIRCKSLYKYLDSTFSSKL